MIGIYFDSKMDLIWEGNKWTAPGTINWINKHIYHRSP